MDEFPVDYVAPNYPLLLLSGLNGANDHSSHVLQANGVKITSESPPINGVIAEALLQAFLAFDVGENSPLSQYLVDQNDRLNFRIGSCSRDYVLPLRKAIHQAPSIGYPAIPQNSGSSNSSGLHSPLSPLSPGAAIYPDGLITSLWVEKHQSIVPAVFLSFFSFGTDPSADSLQFNRLKSEVNAIRTMLDNSNYKIQHAAVFINERRDVDEYQLEERLNNIRRATKLDFKTSYSLNHDEIEDGLRDFAKSVLSNLLPVCMEHYRDLAKHTRRKRDKSSFPIGPPNQDGTKPLSNSGWRVRYEFKLGVLAEFRREPGVAERHYVAAMSSLAEEGGILETTSSWSRRWNESRMLADVIAIRFLRCLLSTGSTTSAVRYWRKHRSRIKTIVDLHGKGTSNYAWKAWEARWYKVMAQLIRSCSPTNMIGAFQLGNVLQGQYYANVEKGLQIEDGIDPWDLMHHSGYWQKLSAYATIDRRGFALKIPEEDRIPPGQSPATRVALRGELYDTYLCPEPHEEYPRLDHGGFDHTTEILTTLRNASSEFKAHNQARMVDYVALMTAKELFQASRIDDALRHLKPLWEGNRWRQSKWLHIQREVCETLHYIATLANDNFLRIATLWELLDREMTAVPKMSYDLMSLLDEIANPVDGFGSAVNIDLAGDSVRSFLDVSFVFTEKEEHAGETFAARLLIRSNAQPGSPPIVLFSVSVEFSGGISEVMILHLKSATPDNETAASCVVSSVKLSTSDNANLHGFLGQTDLTINAGQLKVFNVEFMVRDQGVLSVSRATVTIKRANLDLRYSKAFHALEQNNFHYLLQGPKGLVHDRTNAQVSRMRILPKPPKMTIRIPNLRPQYFTDEATNLIIELANKEFADATATIDVQIIGEGQDLPRLDWLSENVGISNELPRTVLTKSIGIMKPGIVQDLAVKLQSTEHPSNFTLETRVRYHLLDDDKTPITKTHSVYFVIIRPFEANYNIKPTLNPDPWPSYFNVEDMQDSPKKDDISRSISRQPQIMTTQWLLDARIASFAREPLHIVGVDFVIDSLHGGATCTVTKKESISAQSVINYEDQQQNSFQIDIHRVQLEERKIISVDASLNILWRRNDAAENLLFSSSIPVPVFKLPTSEPRVLATQLHTEDGITILIKYTLENPSMHFLSFTVSMELSEDFAFSGPKSINMHLLPLSRRIVTYVLLPTVKGKFIQPQLKVVDAYYQKTLPVQPTDNMHSDQHGILIWVDADE